MPMLELSQREQEVVKRSIENCLNTCHQGGPADGCPDCQSLKGVLAKLS